MLLSPTLPAIGFHINILIEPNRPEGPELLKAPFGGFIIKAGGAGGAKWAGGQMGHGSIGPGAEWAGGQIGRGSKMS